MDAFVVLRPLVGVEHAHQALVLSMLLLWAVGWFVWLRMHVGAASCLAFIAFPLTLQWIVWIGLYPFFLSSACLPYILTVRKKYGMRPTVVVALAVALVFVARIHVFGAALTGLILVILCLNDARPFRAFILTAVTGIPSLFYVYLVGRNTQTLKTGTGTAWDMPYNPLELLLEFFLPGPPLMQAAFLLVVLVAAISAVRARQEQRVLLGAGLVLLVVGLALPIDWSGWELVRPRLLPTAYLLILSSAVVPSRLRFAVAGFVLIFGAWRFAWAAQLHQDARDELAPMLAAGQHLDMHNKRWLYVVTDGPASPAYESIHLASGFLHLTQMVAPTAGGMPFFSHDGDAGIHHVLLKRPRRRRWLGSTELPSVVMSAWWPLANRRLRDLHIATYLESMSWLDEIAVYGLPADGETFAEAGYLVRKVADSNDGHALFVGRFVGCTWDIAIDGLGEESVVTIGFGTSIDIQDAFLVGPSGRLRIEGVPCGPSWFRVEAGCLEARTEDGRVPIKPVDEVVSLACHVPPEALDVPPRLEDVSLAETQ